MPAFVSPPLIGLRLQPQPPMPRQGVRTADRFGGLCAQMVRDRATSISEGCRFLNVWSWVS